jgi:hypothetical protein
VLPPGALVRDVNSPELGVGRVLRCDEEHRSADVLFEGAAQPHVVRHEPGASVRRLRLHPGQTVNLVSGAVGTISQALERPEDGLWTYNVRLGEDDPEKVVSEHQLEPQGPPTSEPLDQLHALRWRGGWRFFARWNLQDKIAGWHGEFEGTPAWLATRRPPSAPAVYAARQVLWACAPRFVVSLPEATSRRQAAGLTILQLMHENPGLSLLIVAPGCAARAWVERQYVDFGGRLTTRLDMARWEDCDELERDELLESHRLVVTPALAARREEVRAYLSGRDWDLIVVDQAHRLSEGGVVASWISELSQKAGGCLALAPPPAQSDVVAVGHLLELVTPGAGRGLGDRAGGALSAAQAAEALEAGDDAAAGKALASCADTRVAELRGKKAARADLLDHLRRHHRLDPRLISARSTQELAARETVSVRLEPAEAALWDHLHSLPTKGYWGDRWRQSLVELLQGLPNVLLTVLGARQRAVTQIREPEAWAREGVDSLPNPAEIRYLLPRIVAGAPAAKGEELWLTEAVEHATYWQGEGSARLGAVQKWIDAHLAGGGGTVALVMTGGGDGVEEFGASLCESLGADAVACCHGEQDQIERAESLRRYRESEECCVIVCDESELAGVEVDVLLRLGPSLDGARSILGPTAAREVVFVSEHPLETALAEAWEAIRAAEGEAGTSAELSLWSTRDELDSAFAAGAEAVAAWGQARAAHLASADPFRALHDAPAVDMEEATELAEMIEEGTIEEDAPELRAWGRCLRLKLRPDGKREWTVGWRPESLARAIPGLSDRVAPGVERVKLRGTFDPLHAQAHPMLGMLAPGSPVIDAIERDVHALTSDGRLTVIRRDLGAWPGKLALVVIARCKLGAGADELPTGLRRRAERRLWSEPYAEVVSLHPGGSPLAKPVPERGRRAAALAPFTGKDVEPKIDPDILCDALPLPALHATVVAGMQLAVDRIRAERAPLAQDAARQVGEDLSSQRAYLEGLLAAGDTDAQAAIDRHEVLLESVRSERFEVDAIAILVG